MFVINIWNLLFNAGTSYLHLGRPLVHVKLDVDWLDLLHVLKKLEHVLFDIGAHLGHDKDSNHEAVLHGLPRVLIVPFVKRLIRMQDLA